MRLEVSKAVCGQIALDTCNDDTQFFTDWTRNFTELLTEDSLQKVKAEGAKPALLSTMGVPQQRHTYWHPLTTTPQLRLDLTTQPRLGLT